MTRRVRVAGLAAGTYAVAVLLRILTAVRTHSLNPDGVIELITAEALKDGRWADAMATKFHPLYAAFVALVGTLGVPLEPAAIGLAIAFSALVAPLVALTAARLTPTRPRQAAFAAGLLAATHPYLARLGGQVMAYSLAHALLALAALLTVLAAQRRSALLALGAGGAVGVGYMARSDALVTGLGLGAGLTLLALLPRPRARPLIPALFLVGTLLGMAPYALAIRAHSGEWRLSLKKDLGSVLNVPDATPGSADASEPPTATIDLRGQILREKVGAHGAALLPLPRALAFATRVGWSTALPHLVLLALLALVLPRPGPDPAKASWLPLVLACAVFLVVQGLLKANWNTTDRIHQSALGVLVAPLAARGLILGCQLLPRTRFSKRLVTAAILAGCLVPGALKLKPNRLARGTERTVGEWIRRDAGEGPLTVCGWDSSVVAYRAGARFLAIPPGLAPEAIAAARTAGARYLVVHLRSRGPLLGDLSRTLADAGAPLARPAFTSSYEDRIYTWWVFRLEDPEAGGRHAAH